MLSGVVMGGANGAVAPPTFPRLDPEIIVNPLRIFWGREWGVVPTRVAEHNVTI